MNIVQALDDPTVFRGVIRDRSTWGAWGGFLKALFGLSMDDTEAETFRACTGRVTLPTAAFAVAWLVIGRRGGKSFALALIAVFLACFVDYRPYLATGERATIVIVGGRPAPGPCDLPVRGRHHAGRARAAGHDRRRDGGRAAAHHAGFH